jgi:oligopeptide/dipeptide ABC transporter ATP-binding protein
MSAFVEARGLTKHFPLARGQIVRAVDDVSFAIEAREIVGLVGESGSGKTTLGRTLIGLYPKTAGEVYFEGEKLPQRYGPADFRRYASRMQMIFQDPYSSLNPRMTVGEIIGEGLRLAGTRSDEEVRARVTEWLMRVGLEPDHANRYPHEFSGGQRQRVGIARALIVGPKFVVCDEPISALDVSVQAQIVRLLGELKETLGLTLLFIAHDLSMVRYVSDRMAVMYLGMIVEIGAADEVYYTPLHPYTQALIAANPVADPRRARQTSVALRGDTASPVNLGAGCRFADRCPKVMDVCRRITPRLTVPAAAAASNAAGPGAAPAHAVACHLYPLSIAEVP